MEDIFNDRLARYSFMYSSRNSNKEKTRFLKALVTDISQVRKDISVIEYSNQKKTVHEMCMLEILKRQIKSFVLIMIHLQPILEIMYCSIEKTRKTNYKSRSLYVSNLDFPRYSRNTFIYEIGFCTICFIFCANSMSCTNIRRIFYYFIKVIKR